MYLITSVYVLALIAQVYCTCKGVFETQIIVPETGTVYYKYHDNYEKFSFSFYEALCVCRQINGTLPTIRNEFEDRVLTSLIGVGKSTWLGLYGIPPLIWLSGRPLIYAKFHEDPSNADFPCFRMYVMNKDNSSWASRDCWENPGFGTICEVRNDSFKDTNYHLIQKFEMKVNALTLLHRRRIESHVVSISNIERLLTKIAKKRTKFSNESNYLNELSGRLDIALSKLNKTNDNQTSLQVQQTTQHQQINEQHSNSVNLHVSLVIISALAITYILITIGFLVFVYVQRKKNESNSSLHSDKVIEQ